MYAIKSDGAMIGYSDTIVFIKLHKNGCYVPCEESEAEGFCAKIAMEYTDEETSNSSISSEDRVYRFDSSGLHGSEPIGEFETVNASVMVAESNKIIDILLGGEIQ